YTHVGRRYGNIANNQILPAYHTIDLGAELVVGEHWDFRLHGTNITDTLALTEGNNRAALGGSAGGNIIYGRSIFGRTWKLSGKYRFCTPNRSGQCRSGGSRDRACRNR